MTLRNSFTVVIRPHGVSDAVDGNNAFPGAMAGLTNLIPSPSTEDHWVPRPARDLLTNIQFLYAPGPTLNAISNHIVVGNVVYGMAVSSAGKDYPFAVNLPNGTTVPVSGIVFANLPTSPPFFGQTQKPLFAQVGGRILVTHPGFGGGIFNPVGFTTGITANVHAGSQVLDGFFPTANIFPGMALTDGGSIPAGTFVVGLGSTDFNTLGQGVVNTTQFTVTDPTGIVPGMMVSGGNGGIQGFVVTISGFVVTMDRVLTTSFANALVSFHGSTLTMNQPATGEIIADPITVTSTANPAIKFGWFDISGANLVQPNCTLNATTTALVPDVVGIQPGHLVTGAGIAAGTYVVDLVNPNIYVAGNPPVFGQTFLTLNYGLLTGDAPPFTFPVVGQTVVGLGLNQGTTVASVTVISQSTNAAQVQIGLSVAALGSSAGFGGAVPTYNLSGVQEVILSQAATISGTSTLTFTGGTPTAPLWGTGDTAINHLPSTPIGVGSLNGRAYFACGLNGLPFSDSLLPCVRTNARQALVPGNGLVVTHCVGQPLASPVTGGIVQSLYAFQGVGAIQQITGDSATNNLAMQALNIATGTLAPASIIPTTLGMAFVSPEGLRIIDFSGTISQPIGESGKGVAVPLINAVDPTRVVAAANGSVLRIALKVGYLLNPATTEYWYDLVRRVWSGPHSHPTTAISPWNDTFIINNENVGPQLYTSPVDTTGVTDYEEDGLTLTWNARTPLQPNQGEMCELAIVESTLGMLLPSDKPVTVTALDEAGAVIDQVQIPANYTNPLWGGNVTPNLWGTGLWYAVDGFFRQHPLPWKKPLVFKQVAFSITGTSRFGMTLGSLELRMERLGYLLQYQQEIPLVISVPPLPFTPGTATPPPQTIASIAPTAFAIVGGVGSAGKSVGTFGATMTPAAPAFAGTWSISGLNANLFTINANSGQLNVGTADIAAGSYQITVTAAPTTIGIAPLAQAVTITVSASLPQMVTAISPPAATFVGGTGSAGEAVAVFSATMSPPTPAFMGTWSISGANASIFTINSATGALAGGATDVVPGSYPLTVTATPFSGTAFSMTIMLTASTPAQRIVAVAPTSLSFMTTATGPVATFAATMSPPAPAFAGTWSVSGNAAFSINATTGVFSTTGIAAGSYTLTVTATQAGALGSPFPQTVAVTVTASAPPPQAIVGISPSTAGITAGMGTAGEAITTMTAVLSPASPAFTGTWTLGGTNASLFTLNSASGALAEGASDIAAGTYAITVTATQAGLTGSPFTQNVTVTASAPSAAIGYSVVVTLFGTATYNANGTVTGTPNGSVFTYNPDTPDAHTTATNLGNFVSDFAGFTQGCMHCTRNDTALRVFFRKDVSPDPTRIEIILELGHFTYDGSAANLGPFSLQILKAGVAQNIPVTTTVGQTWVPGGSGGGTFQVTTAYFPQMGWPTRWRWNPTPRARVRTGAQLLPSALNLVPNFSASLASSYHVVDCGNSGFSTGQSSGGTNGVVTAYSSAFAPSAGNNINPIGVNEGCTISCNMGGTGGRPELGVVTEWNANYIIDGNPAALASTMAHGEVDGGLPLAFRDSTTNWAPINFFNTANVAFFPGRVNQGSPNADAPLVPEPSGLDGVDWFPDLNHMPLLSYVPYLLTGDPFFLENMQFMASWLIGANYFNRNAGFFVNPADPNTPSTTAFLQSFPSWRYATRGLAWALRTYTACFLATPASVPSWLQPKSYWDAMLTANANFGNSWGPDYATSHPTLPQYPSQIAQGFLVSSNYFDEIFFHAYLLQAGSFALNQGSRSEWKHYLTWAATAPLEYGNGTNGAPQTWPVPYIMPMMPTGTDYNGAPAAFAHPADGITWLNVNAQNNQTYTKATPWSWGALDNLPLFGAWVSGTHYHCNSWMVEMRGGVPVLPNAGDVCSVTFSGSFAGSPVTISHTVTAGDIATLSTSAADLIDKINLAASGVNPVIDALLTAVNGSATLSNAGIAASYTLPHVSTAGVAGHNGMDNSAGRMWITYNSDGSYVGGGPIIGDVLVTASMTTATNNSMYVSPNGDGVNRGAHNSACFGRAVCYNAGKSAVSTVAPSGTTPQALTGDLNWCYSPEFKSSPLIVPGGFSSTLPQIGYGGIYGNEPETPSYVDWLRAGMAGYQTAGIAGASTAYSTWKSIFDFYNGTGIASQFNFSMTP